MTDREKLCELICDGTNHDCGKRCNLTSAIKCYSCTSLANHLIANGVTFAPDTNVGGKWISVEDRLPKKITNKVLVYCKCGYIGFGHYEEFQGIKDWYNLESGKPFREWDLEDCETYEVTHWMPLPEPPKEE